MTSGIVPAACQSRTTAEKVATIPCSVVSKPHRGGADMMIVKNTQASQIVSRSGAPTLPTSIPAAIVINKEAIENRPEERCCNNSPGDGEHEREDGRASPPSSTTSSLSSSTGIYFNNSPLPFPNDRMSKNGSLLKAVICLPKINKVPDGRPLSVPPKLPGLSQRWRMAPGTSGSKNRAVIAGSVASNHCDYRKLVVFRVAPLPHHQAAARDSSAAAAAGLAIVIPPPPPAAAPSSSNKRVKLSGGIGDDDAAATVISDDDDGTVSPSGNESRSCRRSPTLLPRQRPVYHQTIRYHPSNLSEEQLLFVEAAATLKRSPAVAIAATPRDRRGGHDRRLLSKRGLAGGEVSESSSSSSEEGPLACETVDPARRTALWQATESFHGAPARDRGSGSCRDGNNDRPLPPPPASLQAPTTRTVEARSKRKMHHRG